MPVPVFSVTDLAAFSGRDVSSYPSTGYTGTALTQAMLIFKLATGLSDFPDSPQLREVARNAVLHLADEFILQQPYQQVMASPLNSEGIGSYHYSKTYSRSVSAQQATQGNVFAKVVRQATEGAVTGVMWFDIAVDLLRVKDPAGTQFVSGGIEIFEHDQPLVHTRGANFHMLSPAEIRGVESYMGWDPAQGYGAVPIYAVGKPSITPPAGVVIEADAEWIEDPVGSGLYVPPWEREG